MEKGLRLAVAQGSSVLSTDVEDGHDELGKMLTRRAQVVSERRSCGGLLGCFATHACSSLLASAKLGSVPLFFGSFPFLFLKTEFALVFFIKPIGPFLFEKFVTRASS